MAVCGVELDVGQGNRLVADCTAFELGGSTEVVVHCCLTGERERVLETYVFDHLSELDSEGSACFHGTTGAAGFPDVQRWT